MSPISDVQVLVGVSLDLVNAQELFRIEIADDEFKRLLVKVLRGPENVESAALVFRARVQRHQSPQKRRSTGDELVRLIISVEPRSWWNMHRDLLVTCNLEIEKAKEM